MATLEELKTTAHTIVQFIQDQTVSYTEEDKSAVQGLVNFYMQPQPPTQV